MVGFFFLEGICIKNSERKADQLMHKLKFFTTIQKSMLNKKIEKQFVNFIMTY